MKFFVFLLLLYGSLLFCSENVFLDRKNRLLWEDTPHTEQNNIKWAMAKSYCKNLYLNGSDDWRLPTKKELLLLVPLNRKNKLKYNSTEGYWTSEELEEDTLNAWGIYIKTAYPYIDDKCETAHVRCVRWHQ